MKKRRYIRTIALVVLLVLVGIQFLPVDRSVPDFSPRGDYMVVGHPSDQMATLIRNACYDCHSYETEYPWYAYVSPVSQWLHNHIHHGRKHVNFSIWGSYSPEDADHATKEIVEMLEKGEMPLKSFTWMHPEARLTDAQRNEMINWFKSQRTGAWKGRGGEGEHNGNHEGDDDD